MQAACLCVCVCVCACAMGVCVGVGAMMCVYMYVGVWDRYAVYMVIMKHTWHYCLLSCPYIP